MMVIVPTVAVFAVAAGVLTSSEWYATQRRLGEELAAGARLVGAHCGVELAKRDQVAAKRQISRLAVQWHVKAAYLYDETGNIFTDFPSASASPSIKPLTLQPFGEYYDGTRLCVFQPVTYAGQRIGAIGVEADLSEIRLRHHTRMLFVLAALGAALIAVVIFQYSLFRIVFRPLSDLSYAARIASEQDDYSVRLSDYGQNELGALASQINALLTKIQERERELQNTRAAIEEQMSSRTQDLAREILERRHTEKTLRASEAKYRELVQNANSIILRMDPRGVVTFFNEYAQKFFGYQEDEILGKNVVGTIVPPVDTLERDLSDMIEDIGRFPEKYARNENENIRRNGERVWVAWTNKAIRDENGNVVEVLCVGNDISARKQAEEELRKAKDAAESANRELEASIERANRLAMAAEIANAAKSQFLANMSHEIRTPMNGVLGMTALLLETPLTPEQREYAQTISESANSLLSIIDDILDFSKIEAGRLQLETIDFDLRETVENVVDLLAVRAMDKGLELACLIEPAAPSRLRGDPGRLRQVLLNLTGNALKFTEQGEVLIEVSVVQETETDATFRFTVTDTGIGIPESARESVFQPFQQVDASMTRKYGGTGLGLAISKQLVEIMHGQLGLESTVGKGSTFWFTLSFPKQSMGAPREPVSVDSIVGKHVLVVDDNPMSRRILETQLRAWGARYEEAENGSQALERLREAASRGKPFDIAMVDMVMPEMDGGMLGIQVRREPALRHTKLVMMSALGQTVDDVRMKQLGFDMYLSKPIKQSQLYACLIKIVTQLPVMEREQPSLPAVEIRAVESATPQARVLLAEDNPVNQKVALRILKRMGYSADCVENGEAAVAAHCRAPYDLILMDIQMPLMGGLEATAAIRAWESEHGGHARIVAMTAHAMKSDRALCLQAGMDDYLPKPVEPDALREVFSRRFANNTNPPPESPSDTVQPGGGAEGV